jgi:hypothetical protein
MSNATATARAPVEPMRRAPLRFDRRVAVHLPVMAKSRSRKKASAKPSPEAIAQREEARRQAAAERRAKAEAEQRRKALKDRLRKLVLPVVGTIAVFAIALFVMRPAPEVTDAVQVAEVEARELAADETFDYGTPTPTSGPYAPGDPVCRVYPEGLEPEEAVAILRVGGVVLWHRPDDEALAAGLAEYAGSFESHVAVAPNPALDAPIVATAWVRLKAYDDVASLVEDDFAGVYRQQRAEDGDCPAG